MKNDISLEESGGREEQTGIVVESMGTPRGEKVFTLTDEHNLTNEEDTKIRIRPGKRYRVMVSCTSNQVGQYKVPVVVAFYHELKSKRVGEGYRLSYMAMELLLKVQTEEVISLLPTTPFSPPKKFVPWHTHETVKGKPPIMLEVEDSLVVKMPLGNYPLTEARILASTSTTSLDMKNCPPSNISLGRYLQPAHTSLVSQSDPLSDSDAD